jgi:polyketide synthase PksN
MNKLTETDKILEMIESHQITPEEGFQLIKKHQANISADQAKTSNQMMYCHSVWKPATPIKTVEPMPTGTVLLFDTDENRYSDFQARLKAEVILVKPGDSYQELGHAIYCIAPNQPADYHQLLTTLAQQNRQPSFIVHLWSPTCFVNEPVALNTQLEFSFYSIFHLSQALLAQKPTKTIRLLYLYLEPTDEIQPPYVALSGFAKTIRLENPKLVYQTVSVPATKDLVDIVATEFQQTVDEVDIRYQNQQRWVKHLSELNEVFEQKNATLLKENGVYLITGGAGGLGLIFAKYFAKHFKAKLILTGRSELNAEQTAKIQLLNKIGAEVIYQKADVSKPDEVSALIAQTKSRFNQINGIIHSAGVIKDALIPKKTPAEIATVLAPKVYGTVFLDEATQNEPLDFFVLFSSLAAIIGNAGQCDYAYANSFMDNFALWREGLRVEQKRFGKTFSINWPLWQEGGMSMNEQAALWLEKNIGLVAMPTAAGLKAFEKTLVSNHNGMAVIYGDKTKIKKRFNIQSSITPETLISLNNNLTLNQSVPASPPDLQKQVEKDLLALCSELLKVKEPDLEIETEFGEYGVDSIMMMTMLNRIEAKYGESIEPNAIAEYPSIKRLAAYLIAQNIVKVDIKTKAKPVINNETMIMSEWPQTANKASVYDEKAKINTHFNIQSSLTPEPVTPLDNHATLNQSTLTLPPDLQKKVENDLLALCSELLKVNEPDLEIETEFGEYGVDSIMMMTMLNRIEAKYGESIEPNAIAEYSTIKHLAEYLIAQHIVKPEIKTKVKQVVNDDTMITSELSKTSKKFFRHKPRFVQPSSEPGVFKIAVIGMACRFPGASSPESFWDNLKNGKQFITEVPADRWKIADYYSANKPVPNKTYSKWGGYIEEVDLFDAQYFGITDSDAQTMDPQHRLLLTLTQQLLDRSGYSKKNINHQKIGVFIGGAWNNYVRDNLDKVPKDCRNMVVNLTQNMMAARISDYYNLTGPSLTVDTACSSSLVSIHQACQSIILEESELAIAGGIELLLDSFPYIVFSNAKVLSDEDKCYVFDEKAKGLVLGEGAGLVFLKPYQKAIEEGDPILGIIDGSAINNDGHTMGITVPNLAGQKEVIQKALEKSGIDPAMITYVEAHGTGTLLGDPIEIKALTQVYRAFTQNKQYCAVGSVKSNIGHLIRAAGIAGFIKVLLALQHQTIPPTLNCEKPHPRFKFEDSPFYPITQAKAWNPKNGTRYAAISSFGFGGTNCHIILEEFSAPPQYVQTRHPLPPTQFQQKRYWLGKEIVDVFHQPLAFQQKILTQLSQGKLTPEQAMQLKNATYK